MAAFTSTSALKRIKQITDGLQNLSFHPSVGEPMLSTSDSASLIRDGIRREISVQCPNTSKHWISQDLTTVVAAITRATLQDIGEKSFSSIQSFWTERTVLDASISSTSSTAITRIQTIFEVLGSYALEPKEVAAYCSSAVKMHNQRIRILLGEKFPFSLLPEHMVDEVLHIQLEKSICTGTEDILNALLMKRYRAKQLFPESAAWKEMVQMVSILEGDCIANAIEHNWNICKRDTNLEAGFLVHVLFKMALNEHYELPPSTSSNFSSLEAGAKKCFSTIDYSQHKRPTVVVECIFPSRVICCSPLLPFVDWKKFILFFIDTLQKVSFDAWRNKDLAIARLFSSFAHDGQVVVARNLELASDEKTQKIGKLFLDALNCTKRAALYPFLYQLVELLPNISHYMSDLFNCPFTTLDEPSLRFLDDPPLYPASTRELCFNKGRRVLKRGHCISGMFSSRKSSTSERNIVTFDMRSGKILSVVPLLPPSEYHATYWALHPYGMVVVYPQSPKLNIFHIETGELIFDITLPLLASEFHITPSGFCYFTTFAESSYRLCGGRIVDKEWKTSFIKDMPKGYRIKAADEYVHCVHNIPKEVDLICGQNGVMHEIACSELIVKNEKLFTLTHEKNRPSLLSMQSLSSSPEFRLAGERIETRIEGIFDAELLAVCEDNTVILKKDSNQGYSFIDSTNRRVTHATLPPGHSGWQFYYETFVDPLRCTLWGWDSYGKGLWKHRANGSFENMGIFDKGRGVSFVAVDERERLCFVNIPF